eukprot:scaffold8431_cov248-Pinguiococcus_pyrenoidosus.AAC.6
MKEYDEAEACFEQAATLHRHPIVFGEIARLREEQGKDRDALEAYKKALELAPEDADLLTSMGLLHLRLGNANRAFEHLGNGLSHDGENPKTILAAGAMLQEQDDVDVALSKYRVAAKQIPNAAELWNNIGMCFFSKEKLVVAISCLKKAFYLSPFEWIISYNLGILFLSNRQYASAFHYLSCCISLNPRYAASYMYLGVALSRMDDFDNACAAYEKALRVEGTYTIHLNYAILLFNNDEVEAAEEHYSKYRECLEALGPDAEIEAHVEQAAKSLSAALGA